MLGVSDKERMLQCASHQQTWSSTDEFSREYGAFMGSMFVSLDTPSIRS